MYCKTLRPLIIVIVLLLIVAACQGMQSSMQPTADQKLIGASVFLVLAILALIVTAVIGPRQTALSFIVGAGLTVTLGGVSAALPSPGAWLTNSASLLSGLVCVLAALTSVERQDDAPKSIF